MAFPVAGQDDNDEMPVYRPSLPVRPAPPEISPEVAITQLPDHVIQSLKEDADAYRAMSQSPEADPHGTNFIVRYMARIEILEAYNFLGNLAKAPAWVDKNWLAHEDDGPTLNVTDHRDRPLGTAHRGDWVVRQNTMIDDASSPNGTSILPDHVAVITADEFARLYKLVPVRPDPQEKGGPDQ